MTWEDLKDMIKEFSEEQLKQTVTVYVRGVDEFYGVDYNDMMTSDKGCEIGRAHV